MDIKVWSMSPSFGYFTKDGLEYLRSHGYEVDMIPQTAKLEEAEIAKTLCRYDAVIGGSLPLSAAVIKGAQQCKLIVQHGAGIDHIDVAAATERGIPVTNTPGVNKDSVAELTFGFFLSLARRIPFGDHSVRQGEWPKVVGSLLKGKTLGIIGMGKIGKAVANLGLGFGMKVIAYDIYKDEDFAQEYNVTYVSVDALVQQADFISLHVMLSESTRNLIDMHHLKMMKETAFLVNVARGGVVNEEDLYEALSKKMIAGAALDVLAQEPPPKDLKLGKLDNVILTPHMGGYAVEVSRQIGLICARNIHAFFSGEPLEYVVNPETLKR